MATTKKTETKHSPLYKKYRDRYYRGGCRKDQLKELVELEAITADEFKEITGEDYTAPAES